MCETQEIRYVHYMPHPRHPDVLGCGCVWPVHMEDDYERFPALMGHLMESKS